MNAPVASAIPAIPAIPASTDWRSVKIHFGKKAGTTLGSLSARDLQWWIYNWNPNPRFPSKVDDALRDALNLAMREPKSEPVVSEVSGAHVGAVGDKITITDALIESVREYQTEFNRKKVIQTAVWLRNGSLYKWTTSACPADIVEGATLSLTATVKGHENHRDTNECFTALKLCKVVGATKVEKPTHSLTLFCDAKASADGFGFCGADGDVLEYGKLFGGTANLDFWPGYHAEQSNSEVCAALLAFDFARRVREAAGLERLELVFNFDAQWMTGMVGKAKCLRDFAKKHGLVVKMNWIAGVTNPADEWTTAGGSKVFTGDLAALAVAI